MVVLREKNLARKEKFHKKTKKLFAPRIELGISRVLGERHDQLDHANNHADMEYLGFDPSTSSLLRTHASNCANTPRTCATPRGFEPLRSKTTHLAGEPLNHSGKVSVVGALRHTSVGFWANFGNFLCVCPEKKKEEKKKYSTSGNRTRGVCVTGRNVTNYTNAD